MGKRERKKVDRRLPGFTLLELLVVIVILGLLASIVGAKMGGRGLVRLQQAEEALLSTDSWARQLAQKQGRTVRLRIDIEAGIFQVEDKGGSSDSVVRKRGCAAGITIERALCAQEERSRGTLVVSYDRNGGSDTYAVKLQTANGPARWVLLAGGSGRPFVFDLSPSSQRKKEKSPFRDPNVEDYFRTLRKANFHAS